MKYLEPSSLAEAIDLLEANEDARCLAGGATLVAMMNSDLLEPSLLISLRRIDDLSGISRSGDHIRIGAMTTHSTIATDQMLQGNAAVIRHAATQIAHPAIRNMGTIGGSICHADPAADFPAAIMAANATLEVLGKQGKRLIPVAEFFIDYLETALAHGEILTAVLVPPGSDGVDGKHLKFSRTHGDYATVSISAVLGIKGDRCSYARVAAGSVAQVPLHLDEVDRMLSGSRLQEEDVLGAGEMLAAAADPVDDVRGSAEYRRMIIPGLLVRAIGQIRGGHDV